MNKEEEKLQQSICKYLDLKYPNTVYTSDLSGIKLSIGSAKKAKSMRCKKYKIPDLLILSPNVRYHGLIIELKANRQDLYKLNGEMRDSEHLNAQKKAIEKLSLEGYKAVFACGIDEAMIVIDCYFNEI